MSMNAIFVQLDPAEIARLQADPDFVESLFASEPVNQPDASVLFNKQMQDRVRSAAPKMMADTLARMDPTLRKQIEDSMGRTRAAFVSGGGGEQLLQMMQQRADRARKRTAAAPRSVLSLDKEWHGVHYVLSGEAEPGEALLSQAVMGGTEIGDDPEGFSATVPRAISKSRPKRSSASTQNACHSSTFIQAGKRRTKTP
jgi:hypothetical protein